MSLETYTKYDSDGEFVVIVSDDEYFKDTNKRGFAIEMWEELDGDFRFCINVKNRNKKRIDYVQMSVKELVTEELKKLKAKIKFGEI